MEILYFLKIDESITPTSKMLVISISTRNLHVLMSDYKYDSNYGSPRVTHHIHNVICRIKLCTVAFKLCSGLKVLKIYDIILFQSFRL
jgi:hypothetical protein